MDSSQLDHSKSNDRTLDATQEQIEEWRRKYKRVFRTVIDGMPCYWRLLTKGEFSHLQEPLAGINQDELGQQEYILEKTLLFPTLSYFDDKPAGVAAVLSKAIVEGSGFGSVEDFERRLQAARENAGTLIAQITLFIHMAFPQYSLEETDNWNIETIVEHLVLSEQVLGREFSLTGGSPEANALQKALQAKKGDSVPMGVGRSRASQPPPRVASRPRQGPPMQFRRR